jgi:dipeptidyl aminopeptidase/acylaminoacyl peptidase
MKKGTFLTVIFFILIGSLKSQVDITYQEPPKEILELADVPQSPAVMIDDRSENIVLIHRNKYISISELSQPEMRLAGLRINPVTNIGSRTIFYNNLSLMRVGEEEEIQITGLPEKPALSNFVWSPDQTGLAFTNTTSEGVELWLLDLTSAQARRLLKDNLNANLQRPYFWFPDGKSFLVKMLPEDKKSLTDKSKAVPTGPRISVSSGEIAQNRTYQDLLQDKTDEYIFEQLARSEIYKVDLNGNKTLWKETAMYSRIDISPDGEYVLVETIEKPFSYLVPCNLFPSFTCVYDKNANKVKTLWESPLLENIPKGFMATQPGMRNINWRNDKPSTIWYVKALDKGNPENETEFRDEVFEWLVPFENEPRSLVKTINRFAGNESLLGIHKELITYKREDGIKLSATLYLPAGYDLEKKEKLPMLMWAYPREYKDAASAGQVTTSPHEFTSPYYGSPVFWITRGYAILDDAAFPVIGEGDKEPNDSFREQLVANAKAAIDAVYEMGYIDRDRVAVGGHSYGAFMTANLLSHSDLFAAGIARSGAYNRTLTPFGFQSEERTYWEAPEVYNSMSPFMHADKMKTPLLLIHGEADNNSGTFPFQSERYFNALKGMGAPARLVFLPKESHGYSARESILHVLWEQDQWLEKWVKNKGKKQKN